MRLLLDLVILIFFVYLGLSAVAFVVRYDKWPVWGRKIVFAAFVVLFIVLPAFWIAAAIMGDITGWRGVTMSDH